MIVRRWLLALLLGSSVSVQNPPQGQTPGTATNDTASAGNVCQVMRNSLAFASAVALTSNTGCNVGATTCPATGGTQSITLTAGDWSCQAMVGFDGGGATSITLYQASISKTSNTLSATSTLYNPTAGEARVDQDPAGSAIVTASTDVIGIVIPPYQITVATTQQLFLVAQATFGASTLSDFGSIECRRMR